MLHFLVVAIALLAIAIVVLGYVWILGPRKRLAAPRLATGIFQAPLTQPWDSGKDNRRDLR